jgi:hypothetical protein
MKINPIGNLYDKGDILMNNKDDKALISKTLWIVRTAVLIALLIVAQVATASLGNPLITGSIVNLLLVVSVMTCGIASGLSVAVVSPVLAKLIGIGPLWALIPFIAAGNIVLVLAWHYIGNRNFGGKKYPTYIITLIIAAVVKFAALYLGIVKIAVPILLKLPEPQATVIGGMFSLPQLLTALIGGALAVVLFPRLNKIIKR